MPFRMVRQEFSISIQPVINPFGIVQPVNRKNDLLVIKLFLQALTDTYNIFIKTGIPEFLVIYSNREKICFNKPVLELYIIELVFYLQYHFRRLNEILN